MRRRHDQLAAQVDRTSAFPDTDLELFWSFAGTPIKDGVVDGNNGIDTLNATQPGTYLAELQYTYGSGEVCSGTDDAQLTFLPDPDLDWNAAGGRHRPVRGRAVTLEVEISPAGQPVDTIIWSNNIGGPSMTTGIAGHYNVTVLFDNGCADTLDTPIDVYVHDKPKSTYLLPPKPWSAQTRPST